MSPKRKAMLASFGRIFAAAALAAYLNLGKAPLDLRLEDLKILFNAGIGAAMLTLVNYLRSGETRFGNGSQDIGMGGDDALGPDGKVQTPPDGQRVDPAAAIVQEQAAADTTPTADGPVVFIPTVGVPVQTDNTERPEDGEQDVSQDPNAVYGEIQ